MFFKSPIKNLSELREQYKALVKKFHPDCGGKNEDMISVNNEYEKLRDHILKTGEAYTTWSDERKDKEVEIDETLRAKIVEIINLVGLKIEICGCWIWVGGNTRDNKEALKTAKFRWNSKKKLWSWGQKMSNSRGSYSMANIRDAYGSAIVTKKEKEVKKIK